MKYCLRYKRQKLWWATPGPIEKVELKKVELAAETMAGAEVEAEQEWAKLKKQNEDLWSADGEWKGGYRYYAPKVIEFTEPKV